MKILKLLLMSVGFIAIIGVSIQAVQEGPNVSDKVALSEGNATGDYNVYSLPMPENLNFAGEIVPIEDPDIYERMDRELLVNTYWQSNAILLKEPINAFL